MALESDFEKQVVRWAADRGGEALKLKIESERGFPDRTIFLPEGEILIPELKRPRNGKQYEQQRRRVAWLQRLGFASDFISSMEELEELYDNHYGYFK